MNKETLEKIKSSYIPGTKVLLHKMYGESLPDGLIGEIRKVDDIGQVHVNWENGSTLALNIELDNFEVII